jgi:uncharacterized protein YggU (UPF0235/DUF167 family)
MKARKFHFHDSRGGSSLAVRVTPRSTRNEIVDIYNDGSIRIRLNSGSSDTESNPALIAFLAQILDVNPQRLEIVAGITGRDKLVAVLDMDAEAVHQKIISQL